MTLEEAIKHCEEVAERQETNANSLENGDDFDKSLITNCLECAREHRQLAKWLKELKKYRAIFEKVGKILADNGYTIDDLDTIFAKTEGDSNISDSCDGCRYELNSTNGNPCYSCGKYKLTEQQPCEDAISREDTLNKINALIADYIPLMPIGWTLPLNIAKTINELPSVQPQPKIDEIIKRIEETRDKDKLCEYPYNRCIKIIREVLGDD